MKNFIFLTFNLLLILSGSCSQNSKQMSVVDEIDENTIREIAGNDDFKRNCLESLSESSKEMSVVEKSHWVDLTVMDYLDYRATLKEKDQEWQTEIENEYHRRFGNVAARVDSVCLSWREWYENNKLENSVKITIDKIDYDRSQGALIVFNVKSLVGNLKKCKAVFAVGSWGVYDQYASPFEEKKNVVEIIHNFEETTLPAMVFQVHTNFKYDLTNGKSVDKLLQEYPFQYAVEYIENDEGLTRWSDIYAQIPEPVRTLNKLMDKYPLTYTSAYDLSKKKEYEEIIHTIPGLEDYADIRSYVSEKMEIYRERLNPLAYRFMMYINS